MREKIIKCNYCEEIFDINSKKRIIISSMSGFFESIDELSLVMNNKDFCCKEHFLKYLEEYQNDHICPDKELPRCSNEN